MANKARLGSFNCFPELAAVDRRAGAALEHTAESKAGDKRWHTRFDCSGGASVRSEPSAFPILGEVKDISRGGVYVETTTPLPVNSEVQIKISVEETPIESAGVVRTSYPLVGMGISLQDIATENQQKLDHVIQLLRIRGSAKSPVAAAEVKAPGRRAGRTASCFG